MVKKKRKRYNRAAEAENSAYQWTARPEKGRDRPTPERLLRGDWGLVEGGESGAMAAVDRSSHPIDRLAYAQVINSEQASAGRDFEALWRAALQTPQTRDSCMTWQPKGFESDDGNPAAVENYRGLARHLGMMRDRLLIRVCVEGHEPRDVGDLREALNEAARWFAKRR